MTAKIFIDGEHGTTGLQIRSRLADRGDIEIISVPAERRKDPAARAEFLNAADVAILCLPDDAARESVALITNDRTKVIDASTAHRTAEGWAYGMAEMSPSHRTRIAGAPRIANPGCYPQGLIALVRPLIGAGIMSADYPVSYNAVSGYSGGGKALMIGNLIQRQFLSARDWPFGSRGRSPTGKRTRARRTKTTRATAQATNFMRFLRA